MRNKIIKWFLRHSLTIASCVLITSLGIVFLVWSSPETTTIGENISTGNITATALDITASTAGTLLTVSQSGTGYGAIITGGNVGIGTTTPASLLTVGSSGQGFQVNTSGVVTAGTWNGNTITVSYGGTGAGTFTDGGIILGSGTSALSVTARPTTGQILVGQSSGDPLTKTMSGDATLDAAGALTVSHSLDKSFDDGKIIDGATSAANAMQVGDTNDKLLVYGSGGTVYLGITDDTDLLALTSAASGTLSVGGGVGKVTAGTFDPIFDIRGMKYATYVASMSGVHEETTGVTQLEKGDCLVQNENKECESYIYKYVIDFGEVEEGSNLWIFYRITDFGENWNRLAVLLSAEGPGQVWYKKDPGSNQLIIYGQIPNSVSYRLTAPRFDWRKWLNLVEDGGVEGIMVEETINDKYASTSEDFNLTTALVDGAETSLESDSFPDFIQKIKQALANLGLFIENGIAQVQELIAEKITAKKARLDKMEMVDQTTGEIYCIWIENGEWLKVKEECDTIN